MTDEQSRSAKLASMAFGQALQGAEFLAKASDSTIDSLIAAFEDASHVDDDGTEYWLARDLGKLLGYSEYRHFLPSVDKAKRACESSGQAISDHFEDVLGMVDIGSGSQREVEDIKLTRYASYLIAQNGDARKKPIAFAQTYFAIQTRRQEIQDEDVKQYVPLHEDQKRLLLRDEVREHNKNLASAAKECGVVDPLDFAIFQNHGYKGLYGGLDRTGIQRAKGLKSRENILDHMGSTELAANLFRATQTEEKLRRDNIRGKTAANATHHEVGQRVRLAIKEIGGTMPENLPKAENIVKVAKRLNKAMNAALETDKRPKKRP